MCSQSAFGRTAFEENRVEVDLGWQSPLSVSGPGAGGRPTAAALLSDLLRISPPPNDRGIGAIRFSSIADPRKHRWLVAARLDSASLQHAVNGVDLVPARFTREGDDAAVITAPATWNSVQRLLTALEGLGANPCIARYERDKDVEVLQ